MDSRFVRMILDTQKDAYERITFLKSELSLLENNRKSLSENLYSVEDVMNFTGKSKEWVLEREGVSLPVKFPGVKDRYSRDDVVSFLMGNHLVSGGRF